MAEHGHMSLRLILKTWRPRIVSPEESFEHPTNAWSEVRTHMGSRYGTFSTKELSETQSTTIVICWTINSIGLVAERKREACWMAKPFLQGGQWTRGPGLCAEHLETGDSEAKLELQFRVLERKSIQLQGSAEKLNVLRICVIKLLMAGKQQSKRAEVPYSYQLRWKDLRIHRCGPEASENIVSVLTANSF